MTDYLMWQVDAGRLTASLWRSIDPTGMNSWKSFWAPKCVQLFSVPSGLSLDDAIKLHPEPKVL